MLPYKPARRQACHLVLVGTSRVVIPAFHFCNYHQKLHLLCRSVGHFNLHRRPNVAHSPRLRFKTAKIFSTKWNVYESSICYCSDDLDTMLLLKTPSIYQHMPSFVKQFAILASVGIHQNMGVLTKLTDSTCCQHSNHQTFLVHDR